MWHQSRGQKEWGGDFVLGGKEGDEGEWDIGRRTSADNSNACHVAWQRPQSLTLQPLLTVPLTASSHLCQLYSSADGTLENQGTKPAEGTDD